MSNEREPVELHPVRLAFSSTPSDKDFGFRPVVSGGEVAPEVEEEVAPKDSSAVESVASPERPLQPVQIPTAPAPVAFSMPTAASLTDADSESGEHSKPSEDESQTPKEATPAPATSSHASSSETSRGKSKPPAPVKPPTAG